VRLIESEAERRRHDQLLERHHYLHNAKVVGKSCVTSSSITESGWRC
jgi:hypothetical protein